MTTTWHIVRKDLQRLRWWLAAWLVVLALPILHGLQIVTGSLVSERDNLATINGFLLWLIAAVAYVLVLLLVQEDGLVGSNQFWLSRPISGRRLLPAKLVGAILILFVLPCVVALPWWLWTGFGAMDMIKAALEMGAMAVIVAVPAALVAVLTDSLSRALLWSLVLGAVVISLGALSLALNVRSADEYQIRAMRVIVGIVVLLLGGSLVVVAQYRLRSQRWLGFMAAGTVTLMVLVQSSMTVWPNLWLGDATLRDLSPERAAGVSVELVRTRRIEGEGSKGERDRDQVETFFSATGVPPEYWLDGDSIDGKWSWSDSRIERFRSLGIQGPGSYFGLKQPPSDPETMEWARTHPRAPGWEWPHRSPETWTLQTWAPFPSSLGKRLTVEPPKYESQLWLSLLRPKLLLELPVRTGAKGAGEGYRVQIVEMGRVVELPGRQPRAILVETSPLVISRFIAEGLSRMPHYHHSWPEIRYVLFNRKRGEAVWGGYGAGGGMGIFVYGVGINWTGFLLVGGGVVRNNQWVEKPGWMEEATLGVISMEREATFTRELHVDRLVVEGRAQ